MIRIIFKILLITVIGFTIRYLTISVFNINEISNSSNFFINDYIFFDRIWVYSSEHLNWMGNYIIDLYYRIVGYENSVSCFLNKILDNIKNLLYLYDKYKISLGI